MPKARKDEGWLSEHKSLYGSDGRGTEDLKRLKEQTQKPQGAEVTFPIIRISNRAQRMITVMRNAAYELGQIEDPKHNKEAVERAYKRLSKARAGLSKYVEQLEYASGVARDTLLRFD